MSIRIAKKKTTKPRWLAEGGETGAAIRSRDWSKTPLGPLESWPQSLRTSVNLCLTSGFPAAVIWGSHYTQIYNDAYRPFCAGRHPQALGLDFRRCRSSEWATIAALFEDARKGIPSLLQHQQVFVDRNGRLEETFFNFSFSPIHDESGEVAGVFHSASETTQQALSERRSKILRELADDGAEVKTVEQACELLKSKLPSAQADLPFVLLYLRDPGEKKARLVVNVGLEKGLAISPETVDLAESPASGWPMALSAQDCQTVQVDELPRRFGQLSCGPYPESPQQGFVLSIAAAGAVCPMGLIVAGVSARRCVDDLCHMFYQQLRASVASLLTSARVRSEESRRRSITAALEQSEERYRAIVDSQTEMVCRFRRDGTILFVNNAYARGLDLTPDDLVGVNVLSFVSDQDRPQIEAQLHALTQDNPEFRTEYPFKGPEPDRWTLWTTRGLEFDSNGQALEFQASGIDITDQKRTEGALRESEEQLRLALQGANAGAWTLEMESGKTFWSEEFLSLYGYSADCPRTYAFWVASVHPDDREWVRAAFWERIKSAATQYRQEFRIKHPQRGMRWILDMGRIIRDAQGRALRISGINIDITERKKSEEVLRESEEKFRRLAEAVPTIVWACRRDGSVTYVNQRWTEYTGQSPEEALGFTWHKIVHPDDQDAAQAAWSQASRAGKPYEGEVRYRRRDGQYRWFRFKGLPLYDEEGRVAQWYGASFDVEDQKAVEQALRDSERHFRALADAAPAILWTTEPDGACTFLSRGWYEYTGQSRQDAEGFGWLNAVNPEDREKSSRVFLAANSKREEFAFDYRIARADGEYRWAIDAGRPRFGDSGEFLGYVGSVIDVHERKQAEETLRESEERFRTLADNMSQLAWMADSRGEVFWFNRRWYEYTGHRFEDAQGWGWTKVIHPEYVDSVITKIRSWDSGEAWEDLFPMRDKNGNYRWFLSRALPICNEQGQVTRWFGTNTDITEQRAAEEALKEADRRKDEFLATLAHELRNPLAPLRNGLEIMQLASDNPASVEKARTMMERQLEHMVHLIDDLLDLSRISRGKITLNKKRSPLADAIEQAVETCRSSIKALGHELTISLPPEPIYMDADPTRLAQVFSNLLNNAVKFTDRGGSIWLSAEQRGDEVVVSVRDSGMGIPAQVLPRVFDMFTQADPTLERTHGGLGIGLSLVKGLVEMHGGSVEAHSDGLQMGSEFIVRLPVAASNEVEKMEQNTESGQSRHRRVLVVDDNQDSALSMATMLGLMGNETKSAYDGQEALDVAADFRPDVILLDIGMPKLNGYDVARKIRQQDWGRDIVLVALTGWGQDEDRRRSEEAGFDHHLVKPVNLAAVREVLGSE